MNEIWVALIKICAAYGISPEVVTQSGHGRYRDKASFKQRLKVFRKLRVDGWRPRDIAEILGITTRGVRKALRQRSRRAPSTRARTATRVRSSRGSTGLVSPAQYRYRSRCLPTRFTYKRTPRGIICKRVTLSKHPSYKLWRAMFARCYDKLGDQYKYYGARGIRVCSRWFDFRKFIRDMGERPDGAMLIRIDRRGHYTPKIANGLSERIAKYRPPVVFT